MQGCRTGTKTAGIAFTGSEAGTLDSKLAVGRETRAGEVVSSVCVAHLGFVPGVVRAS